MSELLIPTAIDGEIQKFGDEAFGAISKSGDYLPRLQLFGGNSEPVKEGRIPMAHYGLIPDSTTIIDLGVEIDVLVCSWRPKAIRLDQAAGTVLGYHNHKSPEFQKIVDESETKDSGCFYGPEFLVWLPAQGKFATFLMGSKTGRRESPRVRAQLGKAATLKVHLIKTAKYSWHGPVCTPCSTPLSILPDTDKLKVEMLKFANPQESVVETAEESTAARAR